MNKSIRNISIFTLVTLTCGWFAVWLNTRIPSPSPQQSLGLLFWLVAPMFTGFLLRWFGGDGWSDAGFKLNLRGNGFWYALSILVYPVTIILTLGLGAATGTLTFQRTFAEFLPIFGLGLAASLVKNIGEEFAWRGYLTPRFKAAGLGSFANHMLTGLIWGLWHIPYWLFFLGADIIESYTSLGMTGFITLAIIGIFPTSLILGELRLKTGSVWPAFLAHNITNAISAQLVTEGFVQFKPGTQLIFSPNTDALLMIAFFWAVGLWMLKRQQVNEERNEQILSKIHPCLVDSVGGALLFLLAIIGASLYFGFVTRGQNAEAIPGMVAASTPYQLAVVQIWLLLILVKSMKRDGMTWKDIGWENAGGQRISREVLIGGGLGIALGLLYVFALSPALARLQQIWDYVPAGELFTSLGASLVPFLIANVLLAPFVEESIYRGYGFTRLLGRFNQPAAIALTCFFFGILHWAGGFWYILATGMIAGGLFAWLRVSRKNVIAPFAAHLAVNIVEAVFIAATVGM